MYATEADVRRLAKNVKQAISTEEIESCGDMVDVIIDGHLRATVEWPTDSNGLDLSLPANLPATVKQVANYMTAGMVEQRAFAQVDGGESRRSSYGAWLYDQGYNRLLALSDLTDPFIDPALEMDAPVKGIAAPQTHFPVSGFSGRRVRRERG